MTNDYDGDLNKASAGVRATVIGYDTATLASNSSAQDIIIAAVGAVSGETEIDQLWLDMLRLRHAFSRLEDSHDGCQKICLDLLRLPGVADRLELPTLNKVLFGLMTEAIAQHSGCVAKVQAESKAKTAASDPYASKTDTDDRLHEYTGWLAEAAAVGAVVVVGGLAALAAMAELVRRAKQHCTSASSGNPRFPALSGQANRGLSF